MFIERAIVLMQRRARRSEARLMQYHNTAPAMARMHVIESDWWYGRWSRDERRRERFLQMPQRQARDEAAR